MKDESLPRALADLGFASDHLRDALKDATPLESLLILPLIEKAVTARRDLNALIKAMEGGE